MDENGNAATNRKSILTIIVVLLSIAAIASAVVMFSTMSPDAQTTERGSIEVDLTKVPEGQAKLYNIEPFIPEGNPYPVLVLHRDKYMIYLAENSGGGKFAEADAMRVVKKRMACR